jgi:flavin-dependent thymidylate synthase
VTKEIQRFADAAMFEAAPMQRDMTTDWLNPKVHLLWMTPDPLGAIAAACRMYEGKPTYNLRDITNEERAHYFQQVQKTHLTAPLEFVKLHFFIEGVSRSFTHQMVRQRTAVYAQESLRFAVKTHVAQESVVPISVRSDANALEEFVGALESLQTSYMKLIDLGVPAEDARELLPHAVGTRLNYCTDLRALSEHSGNRLCTQAQFHWRDVFNQVVTAIKSYPGPNKHNGDTSSDMSGYWWQFEMLADSPLFRPVCYQLNRCPFQASFDRGCSIRQRVELNALHGRPSSEWHTRADLGKLSPYDGLRGVSPFADADTGNDIIPAINPAEWLLDPTAGITTATNRPS